MRKTIFILLSFVLVATLAAVMPPGSVAAKPDSSLQPPAPPAAQQEDEKTTIEDILEELNLAKTLTNDEDILETLDAIINRVRHLGWLELTGSEEDALKLKYVIAKELERLINELPLASTGATSALAAVPTSNQLYEELLKIRAKIERLIILETPPEEVPPPQPQISRLPETERLLVYSAKFLCGPAFGGEGVQRGSYSTAVNVHNPHNGSVILYKKVVIANREDDPRGKISPFRRVKLGPDEAIEIDCIDIVDLLGSQQDPTRLSAPSLEIETELSLPSQEEETGLTTPSLDTSAIRPIASLIRFIKGFVVIYSTAPLDVVAVYTASTPVGFSLDVEYLSPSTVATLPRTPPPEDAKCPQGCQCLTRREAEEEGLTAPCGGEIKICEYDEQQNPLRYCFEKPSEEVRCPQGCQCLTVAEADERNLPRCPEETRRCGTDPATGQAMYCYKMPTGECPQGCVCLTEWDASAKSLTSPCLDDTGAKIVCGRDAQQNLMYCWKETAKVECPQGCDCLALTPEEARKQGLALCADVQCGTDAAGNAMYCYRKITEIECPQGCDCLALTPEEARKQGLTLCADVQCGTNATGKAMYCYEKPTEEVTCPDGCVCLSPEEAAREKLYVCAEETGICGLTAIGAPKYCYEEPTEEEECPQGCRCLTELEARRGGYTWCGGQQISCGYVPGGPSKWCYEKAVPGRITIDPTQDSNLIGTTHTVTVFVYDAYGQPMPNVTVNVSVSGVNSYASGAITTNADGKATFDYSGKNVGSDTIVATVDNLKATAYKDWYRR